MAEKEGEKTDEGFEYEFICEPYVKPQNVRAKQRNEKDSLRKETLVKDRVMLSNKKLFQLNHDECVRVLSAEEVNSLFDRQKRWAGKRVNPFNEFGHHSNVSRNPKLID